MFKKNLKSSVAFMAWAVFVIIALACASNSRIIQTPAEDRNDGAMMEVEADSISVPAPDYSIG